MACETDVDCLVEPIRDRWRVVTSNKPRREGEAFLLRDNKFVMKVYKDAVPDTVKFAKWLATQLNKVEAKKKCP